MLRVDQVHVIRHKVLVEGRSQRQVAKEFGISRVTVRKYVEEAVPVRKETEPRARPVWGKVGPRIEALLTQSKEWTGGKQQLTATRLHELLAGEGHQVGVTLVKELRGLDSYKFTPMLVLTTESGPETKQRGKQAGATGWIVKPFNPEQLVATIKRVLG